jgi:hypothetical protein
MKWLPAAAIGVGPFIPWRRAFAEDPTLIAPVIWVGFVFAILGWIRSNVEQRRLDAIVQVLDASGLVDDLKRQLRATGATASGEPSA